MAPGDHGPLPVPPGAIRHIVVIDLENEDFSQTFGSGSPATCLKDTLLPRGELIEHYYGTGHLSRDNYIAQVSGQAPTLLISSGCGTGVLTLAGRGAADPVSGHGRQQPERAPRITFRI